MQALRQARGEMARALVAPILTGVARRDTGHAAFHGCIDWHSAVHGVWALTAYARMTGDSPGDALIAAALQPEKLAQERALLAARPEFEMPYGRAWLLRLSREHAVYQGAGGDAGDNGALQAMAGEVLASMLAYYGRHAPDPRRGSYGSDSWALVNMLDYAVWAGNGAAEAAVRRLAEAHFVAGQSCGYALEDGHFMAVVTTRAWLVSRVLPPDQLDGWWRRLIADEGLPPPVRRPLSWHHHGLNFSRAWGLWALAAASLQGEAREACLAAYAAHVRASFDDPGHWRGSYRGVGHWVPQFGMLALQPLFAEA